MYSSDRIGLYMGNGLLVFSTSEFSLAELYGPDAVVDVESDDDFIDKLRHYLDNDSERQRLARTGYELGHGEFNERFVTRYMLETVLDQPLSHNYCWPTESYGR